LVLIPALGELYITLSSSEAGYKKYSNGLEILSEDMKAFEPSHFTSITVRDWPSSDPIGVISRSHMDEETVAFLINNGVTNRISAGSSLKFCQLAQGLADIYPRFGPTMEWDTAAGHSILCAAGGKLVDGNGEPFLYGKYKQKYLNGNFVAAAESSFSKIKF
jgi:3'(2'), 5'-bisphosphate nucleotidase